MRSLFARMFVAIALANALAILAVGAVFGAAFERRREQQAFLVGDALARHGADAATALGAGGRERAAEILARLEARTGLGVTLVDGNGAVVVGHVDAPHGTELVEATRGSTEPITASFEGRTWHAVGLPGGLVAVGAPTSPRAAFGLSPPTFQLVLVFLLSAIVSLLLARWLSRPRPDPRGDRPRARCVPRTTR